MKFSCAMNGSWKKPILKKFYWWTFEIIQKFGPKMKNFEIFFDIIDNHTWVHMLIKKIFKIFHFPVKFLNYLKGPPVEFFKNRFFSISMHSATKFHIDLGCFLTFGLGPLPRELWIQGKCRACLFDTMVWELLMLLCNLQKEFQ